MKTKPSADKLKIANAAIEQIAEADVRNEAPRSYPKEYSLAWCQHAMVMFYTKFIATAILLFAGLVSGEIALWKVMKYLVEKSIDNKPSIEKGWLAGAFLLVALFFLAVWLSEKIMKPGDKVEKLVHGVNDVKRRYRKLGKAFLVKLAEEIPTSPGGGKSPECLQNYAERVIESLLVNQAREVMRLEDLGSFWRGCERKKFSVLHKKGLALKVGIDKVEGNYFNKVPTTVVFHDVRI